MKINSTPTLINTNNTKKNVSFTSLNSLKTHLLDKYLEPARAGNMSRDLFIAAAFTFLLSGRLINSRDNNERRETITRDVPTIVIAVKSVPFFETKIAKYIQNKLGFAIKTEEELHKTGTFKEITNPKTELKIANSNQLKDWYHLDDNFLKNKGFDCFMDRLNDLGGNLKKITSKLSTKLKEELKDFSADNEAFLTKLSENPKLKKDLEDAFKNPENKALKEANFLKSLPKIAGIAITLGIIGYLIPTLNIFITKMVNTKKGGTPTDETQKRPEPPRPIFMTAQNSSAKNTKKAFEYFLGK